VQDPRRDGLDDPSRGDRLMRTIRGLEELAAAEGDELGVSDWHDVTQERIDAFAAATGDRYWIHTDPERAREGRSDRRSRTASTRSRWARCSPTRS
jgi:acyl dehydratase